MGILNNIITAELRAPRVIELKRNKLFITVAAATNFIISTGSLYSALLKVVSLSTNRSTWVILLPPQPKCKPLIKANVVLLILNLPS